MSDDEEFNAEAFLKLPLKERVKLCRRLGERAQALAAQAAPKYRVYYLEIAKQWQTLADEMEQTARAEKI